MVSTTTVSRAAGTTTIAAAPGSANDTTEVVPKAVPEATITTPSLHLPSTTSILVDSEMTTGNSNLSQHCKRMRFLFPSSVSQLLMHWWETWANVWVAEGSGAGTAWGTAGDISSSLCRHLAYDGCCHSSHLACQGTCISFYPRHMKGPESSHQPLPCAHPSFSAAGSRMGDSAGASPVLIV